MNGRDRISNLGDDVLHNILRFLNTRHSVQTSVLSKRWKDLWTTLPHLNFHFDTFLFEFPPESVVGDDEWFDVARASFDNFITQVLSRRQPINVFKISFSGFPDRGFPVHGLIRYAVEHNVRELLIHSFSNVPFLSLLPDSLYTCQSLTVLDLQAFASCHFIELPKILALPALNSLHLRWLSITGPNFDPILFSGCPNLETLKLLEILVSEDKIFRVSALNLKMLELQFQRVGSDQRQVHRCKVVINAPKLKTLSYHGYAPILCSEDNLPSLDDVCFHIYHSDNKEQDYALQFINTFKEFRHAKFVTLSSSIVEDKGYGSSE